MSTDIQETQHSDKRTSAARFRSALVAERRSAALYRGLAEAEAGTGDGERRRIFQELAQIEERHAGHWADRLTALGEPVPAPGRPGLRAKLLAWAARRFSLDAVLPFLERAEHADAGLYDGDPEAAPGMAADERSHARVLTGLRTGFPQSAAAPQSAGVPQIAQSPQAPADIPVGRRIARSERWHRSDRSGALRAAVFGVNDGLVSNTSLVMGFAGSGAASGAVLFAGLAGLLAGAFSMAAGEYISMRSQREAYEREIALEAAELREDPEAEAAELALIYRAKGLDAQQAETVAATVMADRETALDTMAREELGLDPGELGSPWSAALSSLTAFALGAAVAVVPYLFAAGTAALVIAIALAAGALMTVGTVLGALNGKSPLRSGVRQLLVGAGAAIVVYGLGHVVGHHVG